MGRFNFFWVLNKQHQPGLHLEGPNLPPMHISISSVALNSSILAACASTAGKRGERLISAAILPLVLRVFQLAGRAS